MSVSKLQLQRLSLAVDSAQLGIGRKSRRLCVTTGATQFSLVARGI